MTEREIHIANGSKLFSRTEPPLSAVGAAARFRVRGNGPFAVVVRSGDGLDPGPAGTAARFMLPMRRWISAVLCLKRASAAPRGRSCRISRAVLWPPIAWPSSTSTGCIWVTGAVLRGKGRVNMSQANPVLPIAFAGRSGRQVMAELLPHFPSSTRTMPRATGYRTGRFSRSRIRGSMSFCDRSGVVAAMAPSSRTTACSPTRLAF